MHTVHRATPSDINAIAPLFDAYRQFYGQAPDLAGAHDWLHQRMQADEAVVLVARDSAGEVEGFAQLYRMLSSVRTARTRVLNDLYVDPRARRNGVGRALLDAAVAFARDEGAAGIALETSRDNAAARALYRSAGWVEEPSQWYSVALTP